MSHHAKLDLSDLNERFTAEFTEGLQKLDEVFAECRRVLDVVTGPWDGRELPESDEETAHKGLLTVWTMPDYSDDE